ncbi:hypothetical protein EUGRSUZ_A02350 [Eucalyptus grandis]|uniref:Uncharacterized protein n=2 Tax=Eucalyptus grandis TaxID=71139 RepID=A0ACC3M652_EUCGR|nr:hypothetical protein EUGRSUZ_A02350 [Eucalyptus grandis]
MPATVNSCSLNICIGVFKFRFMSSLGKLHVARRARSKIIKSSDNWKSNAGKMVPTSSSEFESTKAASGITSSSSEGSSAKNLGVQKFKKKREENRCEVLSRKRAGSTHMRRQADAILTFLSGGCASEVKIRQVLGDSPDTSKALRMLLKLDEVKRSGTGGRHDPYIYEVSRLHNMMTYSSIL